jgi:ribose-phosphate pyrophosphokinase
LVHFALPGFESLLSPSAPGAAGKLTVGHYVNRELTVAVRTEVAGKTCAVLGSVAPPAEQLLGLARLADTLKQLGAARVHAILPYLAYARQDREEEGRSLGVAWLGKLLRACGVDGLTTVDIHSPRAGELLEMPVSSLSPAELFANEVRRLGLLDATIVAPDEGARERSRALARAAGIEAPVAYLRKQRSEAGVVHRELIGEVGARAIVVDDILDTGGTLISCCHRLHESGATEIAVMVTHGLFSGELWMELMPLVTGMSVTDSVPSAAVRMPGGVRIVPIRPLLEARLAELAVAA